MSPPCMLHLDDRVLKANVLGEPPVQSSIELDKYVGVVKEGLCWGEGYRNHPLSYALKGSVLTATISTKDDLKNGTQTTLDLRSYVCLDEGSRLRSRTVAERLARALAKLPGAKVKGAENELGKTIRWYISFNDVSGDHHILTTETLAEQTSFEASLQRNFISFDHVDEEELKVNREKTPEEYLLHLETLVDGRTCAAEPSRFDVNVPSDVLGAVLANKRWRVGETLTYAFLGGNTSQQRKVEQASKEWTHYANIKFSRTDDIAAAKVRISFDPMTGSWSTVGTGANTVTSPRATMNLGWIGKDDVSTGDETGTILHEFGHLLGLMHEHQSPAREDDIQLDVPKVIAHYKLVHGWKESDVRSQVINMYASESVSNYSKLDTKSIMMYPLPAKLNIKRKEIGRNQVLSDLDKAFIVINYPYPDPHPEQPTWTFEHALDVAGVQDASIRETLMKSYKEKNYEELRTSFDGYNSAAQSKNKENGTFIPSVPVPQRALSVPNTLPPAVEHDLGAPIESALAKLSRRPSGNDALLPPSIQRGLLTALATELKKAFTRPELKDVLGKVSSKVIHHLDGVLVPHVQKDLEEKLMGELTNIVKHPVFTKVLNAVADGAVSQVVPVDGPPSAVSGQRMPPPNHGAFEPRIDRALRSSLHLILPELAKPAPPDGLKAPTMFAAYTFTALQQLVTLPDIESAFQMVSRGAVEQILALTPPLDDRKVDALRLAFEDLGKNAEILKILNGIAIQALSSEAPPMQHDAPIEPGPRPSLFIPPSHIDVVSPILGRVVSHPMFKDMVSGMATIVINNVLSGFRHPIPPKVQNSLRMSLSQNLSALADDDSIQAALKNIGKTALTEASFASGRNDLPVDVQKGLFSSLGNQLKILVKSSTVKDMLSQVAVSTVSNLLASQQNSVPPHVEHHLRTGLASTLEQLSEHPAINDALDGISTVFSHHDKQSATSVGDSNAPVQHFLGLGLLTRFASFAANSTVISGAVSAVADVATNLISQTASGLLSPLVQHSIRTELGKELTNALESAIAPETQPEANLDGATNNLVYFD